jgi:hypothetical protein
MKNLLAFLFFMSILSCENKSQKTIAIADSTISSAKISSSISPTKNLPELHDSISGDFDGDGKKEFAVLEMTKNGNLNLIAGNDSPATFKIIFRNEKINPLNVHCCDIRLIKEEDLDGDGADEISVFSNEGNGCSFLMFTYTLKNGNWKELLEPFVVPTACNPISDKELQERIFRENGKIYFLDVNANTGKLVRKIAALKS